MPLSDDPTTVSREVDRWLKAATRGLPPASRADIRAELLAHFEDACADYQAEGLTLAQAQRAALADLGNSHETARAFGQTQQLERRYLAGAIGGLVFPVVYLITVPINEYFVGGVMFNLAIFLPLIYIVYSWRNLLADRVHGVDLRVYERVVGVGIVVACVPRLFEWLIYHRPAILEAYTRSIWDIVTYKDGLLTVASFGGLFLTALGLIFMAEQGLRLRETLYGWLKPSAILLLLVGLAFIGYGIASLYGDGGLAMMVEWLIIFASVVVSLMWSYIYLRARADIVQLA